MTTFDMMALIGVLAGFLYWMKSDLKGHIDLIRGDISRLDADVKNQGVRVDRLYQMFVDLLKDGKK